MESIELVEFDLERDTVELESVHRRIGAGNTKILSFFGFFLAFFSSISGFWRARRDLV